VFKNLFSYLPNKSVIPDFSAVNTDMHSHLIPGLDDGAKNLTESVDLARRMYDLGYRKLITTPHIQQEFFRNTPEIILNGLDKVRKALKSGNVPIELQAGAEYLIDDGFEEKLSKGNLLTFSGKYLLVELSYYNPHPNLKEFIFHLQVDGYKVILAHPERYTYWFNDFAKYEELKDRGVFFQSNVVSLSRFYPDPVKKMAEKLIDKGMIDFLGSDMHNMNYMQALEKALKERALFKLLGSGKLLNRTL
jgi:protein-tyrosine phosphatase